MVLTPIGAEAAKRLINIKDEVRFVIAPQIITVVDQGKVVEAHGITQAFNKYDKEILSDQPFEDFLYWKITISTGDTKVADRMSGWSIEEKLNIIGAHEAGHIGRIGYADMDHSKMIAYSNELISRFQYSELFPDKATAQSNWLKNYNNSPSFGVKKVNKYYNEAINGLIKAGKMTDEDGSRKKDNFENTNGKE